MQTITRNIVSGVVTIIPLAVTVWLVWLVVDLLIGAGRPAVRTLARAIGSTYPEIAALLLAGWFQSAVALLVTLIALFVIGKAANAVIGRRVLQFVDGVVDRLPIAKTIYSATRMLIGALQGNGRPESEQVVLLEFPCRGRHSVGLVTRIFPATEERCELASVYVATTPNPTSGFAQIVPTSDLIPLDWTKNEAIAFIVSGGAMSGDVPHDLWKTAPPAKGKRPPQAAGILEDIER